MSEELQILDHSPQSLVARAVESGAGVEVLERLMMLQERWEQRQAKRAFDEAMAKFRSLCPPTVFKAHKSHYNTYADLSDVVNHVAPHLAACDLSYHWSFPPTDKGRIRVRCTLSHIAGHEIYNEVEAEELAGKGGQMSWIQALRSTTTYLRRLTLEAVTGVVPSDEDDDGAAGRPAASVEPVRPPTAAKQEAPPTEPPAEPQIAGRIAGSVQRCIDSAKKLISDENGDLEKAHAELLAACEIMKSPAERDLVGATIRSFLDVVEPENRDELRADLLAAFKVTQ